MTPSSNWLPMAERGDGLSYRVGANGDLTNADYIDYPPFAILNYANGHGEPHFITWKINDGTFPINQSIDDWSIAYTAVNNTELSMNNIGVFISNEDTPDYITDNTQQQKIAFLNSGRFYQIYQNLYNIPASTLTDSYRFHAPRANDRYNWSPNAITASYSDYNDTVLYLSNINYQGFAVPYESFGIKSLFLEIYIVPINIGSTILSSYNISLKEYSRLTPQAKADNPIGCAYVRVHRRGNINGSYTYSNHDNADFRPVMSTPFSDGNNEVLCYFSQCNLMTYSNVYFPLWGNAFYNAFVRSDQNNNYGDFFYGYDKISGKRVTDNHNGTFVYEMYMEGTDDNIEYLRQCCAAYGLFFCDDIHTDDNQNLESDTLDNNDQRWIHNEMHLGIIEDTGYTEGRYTTGVMNALQNQFQWKTSTDSIYDPAYPPEPENEYNTQTVFNTVSGISTMTQRYAMTAGAVKNLGAALWSISADLIDDGGGGQDYSELNEKILDTFLTNNPIDCIVSLRKYPFEISKDDSTFIKLGKYETTVGAYTMSKTLEIFEFRMRNNILPIFNDSFMDYEPYTHFELYVPFCGTVSIEPADILGRQLSVKLAVDYSTGTCTAYILTDDLVIKTISGQIAIDIPVSGIQSVTAASQINNAIAQASTAHKQEKSATLGNVSVGGAVQFMLNPVKTIEAAGIAENTSQRADYELQHQNIQPHLIGSASSAASWLIDFSCRLLIYYPTGEILFNSNNPPTFNPVKLLEYGHTVGFACCMTGALSSFSGLTVAVKANLNGITTNSGTRPATLQELQMLEAALNEGVIL